MILAYIVWLSFKNHRKETKMTRHWERGCRYAVYLVIFGFPYTHILLCKMYRFHKDDKLESYSEVEYSSVVLRCGSSM